MEQRKNLNSEDQKRKKTNLDILDNNIWNWIKNQKNQYSLRSVSDFIFRELTFSRNMQFNKTIILIYLEKFFEYSHFDIKALTTALQLKADVLIQIIDKEISPDISLFDFENSNKKRKIVKKIHAQMIENGILPRELRIAYKLRQFLDKNRLDLTKYELQENARSIEVPLDDKGIHLNNKEILAILFSDPEERHKEIYTVASDIADRLVNQDIKLTSQCNECKTDCMLRKPDFIYYKSGIEVSMDDIEDDLIAETLKGSFAENYLVYYGASLVIAIDELIRSNLAMIRDFINQELYVMKDYDQILKLMKILEKGSRNEANDFAGEPNFIEKINPTHSWLSLMS